MRILRCFCKSKTAFPNLGRDKVNQEPELKDVLDALRQVQSTLKELDERSKRTDDRVSQLEGKLTNQDVSSPAASADATANGGSDALTQTAGDYENPAPQPVIPSQAPSTQGTQLPPVVDDPCDVQAANLTQSTASPTVAPTANQGTNVPVTQTNSQANTPRPAEIPAANPVPTAGAPAEKPQGSLESRIGMYWLNRLGVVILVIGLGYLLSHAYEMIGPVGKLAVGFAASLALVAGGEVLARRPRLSWYGQGLIGGGYALAYFAVYAMQNIASVKVIDDPMMASIGLLGVAAVSMFHAVFRRSEAIGLLSTLLAFGTISLATVTTFSVAATAITVAGLALTTVRMRWYGVQAASVLGTYATYVFFTAPRMTEVDEQGGFWLSFAFLAMFWGVFNFVSLLLARAAIQSANGGPYIGAGIKRFATLDVFAVNAAAFVILTMMAMDTVFTDFRYAFLLACGLSYGVFSLIAHRFAWKEGSTLSTLIGLGLATAAVPLKLDAHATIVVWLLQVPLLMFVGTRFDARAFRWFAYGLAVVTAVNLWTGDLSSMTPVGSGLVSMAYGLLVGIAAVAAFFASNLAIRYAKASMPETERNLSGALFGVLAAGFMLVTTLWHAGYDVMSICFAIECVALIAIALRWASVQVHGVAAVFAACTAVSMVVLYQSFGQPVALMLTLLLYCIGLGYRRGLSGVPVGWRVNAFHAYFLGTTASAYIATIVRAEGVHTYLPLAIEALVLTLAGFVLRDRVVRAAGLVALLPTGYFLAASLGAWTWYLVLPVVACTAALYAAYRLLVVSNEGGQDAVVSKQLGIADSDETKFATNALAAATSLLATATFWQLLSWQTLAGAWAMEGLTLVALGFMIKDKLLRLIGLGVFAITAAKLLFYDLSGADTVERIISFIVAGVVLLVASFAYTWFDRRLQGDKEKSSQ